MTTIRNTHPSLDQTCVKSNGQQGCKMDCENCDNCEIANCDCEKNTISQITQFSFLSIGRNRNITQFDFLEGRNCESCENCYIQGFFFEKWANRSWILDLQNFSNSNFIFGFIQTKSLRK